MFLDNLLRASIEGGIAILVLYFGLKAFPSIPPKARVWLWRIVFVKLAISLLPLGAVSLKVLPPKPVQPQILVSDYSDYEQVSVQEPARAPAPSLNPWICAWITGAGVATVLMIRRAGASRTTVLSGHPATDAVSTIDLEALARKAQINTPRLLISSDAPTALVIGFGEPTILLPEELQGSEDASLIVAHEIAHIAHRDLQWNALISAVQILFFFHPLVWLAIRCLYQAQESAADAFAIQLTETSPKRYGQMLLRATLFSSKPMPSLSPGIPVGASTSDIRKRLKDLRFVNSRVTMARVAFVAILTCAIVAMTPAYRLQAKDAAKTTAHRAIVIHDKVRHDHTAKRSHHSRSHRQVRLMRDTVRTSRGRNIRLVRPVSISVPPAAPTIVISQESAPAIAIAPRAASAPTIAIARSTAPGAPAAIATAPARISIAPRAAQHSERALRDAEPPTAPEARVVTIGTAPTAPELASPASIRVAPAAIAITAAAPNVQTHTHRVKHVKAHGHGVGIGYGYGKGVGITHGGAPAVSSGGHSGSNGSTISNDVHVTTAVGSGTGHGEGQSSSSSSSSGH